MRGGEEKGVPEIGGYVREQIEQIEQTEQTEQTDQPRRSPSNLETTPLF
jgi:hypothetical protein